MWPFTKKKAEEPPPAELVNVGRVYAVVTLDDGERVAFLKHGTAWYDLDGVVEVKMAEVVLHETLVRATERGFLPVFAPRQQPDERAVRWLPVSRIMEITSTQVDYEEPPS